MPGSWEEREWIVLHLQRARCYDMEHLEQEYQVISTLGLRETFKMEIKTGSQEVARV